MSFNLATILRESRRANPGKPLCHVGDRTLSYRDVDHVSGCIATSLSRLGIKPADKVAVQLPNLPEFLFSYFGILKAGAVIVPLNTMLSSPEIRYHLQDCDAKLLITFETCAGEAIKAVRTFPDSWAPIALPELETPNFYWAQSYSMNSIAAMTPANSSRPTLMTQR